MRAIRELPLAASLLLPGFALFFGGGPGDGSVLWLGCGALLAAVALLATRGIPGGATALAPFAAFTIWSALSISWSALPDRSWDYANRAFLYLLFALLGLWLAGRTRELAAGLAILLGAVVAWSLLGKVLPPLYDDYGRVARLRGPVGLWNQLALLADFALPLALWRRGRSGTLLAYSWLVALLLTYSRGGLLTALVVLVLWFVFTEERVESAMTLAAAAVPAGAVTAIAFALPGVTSDGQASHTRWRDGLIFGALLVAGSGAAIALERLPRPRISVRALRAAGVLVLVAVLVVAVVKAGSAWHSFASTASVSNAGPQHIANAGSNFRLTWWKQAWHGFEHHPLAGTGAGSFHVTNLRYRTTYLDVTTEPHELPLQFLSETGIVGLGLFGLAMLALLARGHGRRGHELALALLLPAYLVHSLVDVDWDFAAVSTPAFLAAGALAARPVLRRASGFAVLAAAGAALAAVCVLLLPWLGARWSSQALDALGGNDAHVQSLAKRARAVDPLLVEPLWWQADAQSDPRAALALYAEATRKQPQNAQTWLYKARFELDNGCARLALADLYHFVALDPYAAPANGPDDYRRALALVNSGTPTC